MTSDPQGLKPASLLSSDGTPERRALPILSQLRPEIGFGATYDIDIDIDSTVYIRCFRRRLVRVRRRQRDPNAQEYPAVRSIRFVLALLGRPAGDYPPAPNLGACAETIRERLRTRLVGCMLSDFMVVRPKQAECLIGTPLEFPQVY